MAAQSINLISVPVPTFFYAGTPAVTINLRTVPLPTFFDPYPGTGGGGVTTTYTNRVWNTTSSIWVRWDTVTSPDPSGASYPGPGTFGVDTQTPAHVESVFVT